MKRTYMANHLGSLVRVTEGQEVTVFKVGSGRTTFGERAHLVRGTKHHLVFETESGATVKTRIDNLNVTVGKADREGYRVSLRRYEDFPDMVPHKVNFWDSKKQKFVKK